MNYGQNLPLCGLQPLRLDKLAISRETMVKLSRITRWRRVEGGERPPFGLSHRISAIFTLFLPPPLRLMQIGVSRRANEV